ncbi:hypothetical protein T484DRAFT_1821604 [Baffinella frigidus]|nr:hypothetical protein T484DRAFT_1821604 [Cryptophyta sp. CCMP2293]
MVTAHLEQRSLQLLFTQLLTSLSPFVALQDSSAGLLAQLIASLSPLVALHYSSPFFVQWNFSWKFFSFHYAQFLIPSSH